MELTIRPRPPPKFASSEANFILPRSQYDLANSLKAAAESASHYHPHFAEWPESNTEPISAIMQNINEKSKNFDNIAI